MRIIGFGFNKISAEKTQVINRGVKIKSDIKIKDIYKEKIENLNEEVLRFDFEFSVEYDPKTGNVTLAGFILTGFDKEKAKEILKKWKTKKIPDEIRIPLFNFILTKCNIKALGLEEDLALPSHIPLPRITNQPADNNRSYVQ